MKTQTTSPAIDPRNPPAVHEWTGPTGVNFRDVRSAAGTYYRDTTPPTVVAALDSAMRSKERVRLFLGDSETGRDWLEENDVCGTVGRSMGPIKAPLLIASARRMGGGIISADCVVRLLIGGREVYRHPKYNRPAFSVSLAAEHLAPGCVAAVLIEGKVHARFKNARAVVRWVSFMEGRRLSK